MYIPVLLSTFGLVLRGIPNLKITFSELVCPPKTNGIYPNCDYLQPPTSGTCKVGFTGTFPHCKKVESYQRSAVTSLPSTSILSLSPASEIPTSTSELPTSIYSLPTSTSPLPTLSGSCETGYIGTFPDCVKLKRCPRPAVGFKPNCFLPPCPPAYTGTFPDCEKPATQYCPFGTTGVFPNCEVQLIMQECQEGSACSHVAVSSTQPMAVQQSTTQPPSTIPPSTNQPSTQQPTLSGSCEEGYIGTFPDCVKLKRCPRPTVGFKPNCFLPPCPPTYTGTYPDCEKPATQFCPFGTTGVFPNCEVQLILRECKEGSSCSHAALSSTQPMTVQQSTTQPPSTIPPSTHQPTLSGSCEEGYTGTFPDCVKLKRCRRPTVGFMPNCFLPPCPPTYTGTYPDCEKPTTQFCPFGTTGVFPNCEVQLIMQECPECSHAALWPTQSMTVEKSTTEAPSTIPPSTQQPKDEIEWNNFKLTFNKTYVDQSEDKKRQQIFLQNQEIIAAHNKLYDQGLLTYSLAINKFNDRTHDEFIGKIGGLTEAASNKQDHVTDSIKEKDGLDSAHGSDAHIGLS